MVSKCRRIYCSLAILSLLIGTPVSALNAEGIKDRLKESWIVVGDWVNRAGALAQKEGRALVSYLRDHLKKESPSQPITVNLPTGE